MNSHGLYGFGVGCALKREFIACLVTLSFSIGLLAYTRHEHYAYQTGFVILLAVSHLLFLYCLYMRFLNLTFFLVLLYLFIFFIVMMWQSRLPSSLQLKLRGSTECGYSVCSASIQLFPPSIPHYHKKKAHRALAPIFPGFLP